MGFIKKVVGGVGKVVTGIGKGVASIFTGGRSSRQSQPAPSPAPQTRSLPSMRLIGDPPDAPYMQSPLQRLGLSNSGMGGGSFGGMGGNYGGYGIGGMGGMGSFGGMSQRSMMPSSPMPSAPNGGQSFYGGASNSFLERMRMMRQNMPMGMTSSGDIRRGPFGLMM